ncbi:tRNA (adenosine(37)-N6)-threonylcarbamoyltransferase complex dimerization subunit type 1 TsaB, partial [bacterium AH-315-P07]|nr:tRNA (adenosine(37)-N6)-threonylcarbamoyltransferase complex dimerization subunit type 1 TsaB [bacterium AH-315-P07]
LLAFVEILLDETNITLSDIDLLAVAHGPGSFTGVRVGVSAWKGLAAGAQIPIIGVSTLDALARRVEHSSHPVCPLLDAKMSEVYSACYRYENGHRETINTQTVATVEAVLDQCPAGTLFLGDGAALYREKIRSRFPDALIMPESCNFPGATAIAAEAVSSYDPESDACEINVSPVYLRKSQAEVVRDTKLAQASAS